MSCVDVFGCRSWHYRKKTIFKSLVGYELLSNEIKNAVETYFDDIWVRQPFRFQLDPNSFCDQGLSKPLYLSHFSPRHSIIYNYNKFRGLVDLNESLINNKIRLKNHLISNHQFNLNYGVKGSHFVFFFLFIGRFVVCYHVESWRGIFLFR